MKNLLKFSVATMVLGCAALMAHADITFSGIGAEEIYNGSTALTGLAANDSLVLLVAHTSLSGNFGPLYEGSISVGSSINPTDEDIVLAQLSLSGNGVLNSAITLALTGNWVQGDALAIYWIPSASAGATNIAAAVSYGMYTDPGGLGGSEPWITPADGTTYDAMFFSTTGANFPMNAAAGTGFATLTTVPAVPEPAAGAGLAGVLALGLAARRRR